VRNCCKRVSRSTSICCELRGILETKREDGDLGEEAGGCDLEDMEGMEGTKDGPRGEGG
jgi:hypothetical protein